jgi:hypothetical protein
MSESMSELEVNTSALVVSAPRLVDDLGAPIMRRTGKKKKRKGDDDTGIERQEQNDERETKMKKALAEKVAAKAAKDAADQVLRTNRLTEVRRKLAQRLLPPRPADQEGGDGDDGDKTRKARVSCGLSQEQINFYAADYKLNELEKKIVKGVSAQIFAKDGDGNDFEDLKRMEKNRVKSYRKVLNASCDKEFKAAIAKHIHLEIFKEITIERLVTAYMIAKREAVGAKDGEILHVDWFALLTEFSKSLKDKFKEDNDACLEKIERLINSSTRIANSEKTRLKELYAHSASFFRVSTQRKIQSIIAKTLAKISSIWEALNFSTIGGLRGLPSHNNFKGKSKGALFAFASSGYSLDMLHDDVLGIDDFTRQVIVSSSNVDGSMDKLIAYQLIPKNQYYTIPKNVNALDVFLNAAADAHDVVAATPIVPVPLMLTDQQVDGIQQVPSPVGRASDFSSAIENRASTSSSSTFFRPDEVSFGSSNDGEEDAEMSFSDGEDATGASSSSSKPDVSRRRSGGDAVSVDFPEVVDRSNVQLSPPASFVYRNAVNTASSMKAFLKELLTDVSGTTPVSVLRLYSTSNSRETGMLEFIKFMDTHQDSSLETLYDEFVGSKFFQRLTCRWLVPFKKTDFTSIVPDGYCFYRALFQCLLRSYENYTSSLSTVQQQDQELKMSNEAGGGREAFFIFFSRLEKLLPECYGKSRVMNAHMTFFNMKCGLDEAFWGIIDAVAFLDFNCTAFVYHKDRSLEGYWAQYKCSSIFAMESRDLVVENMVGTAPSLADVAQVVKEEPSFVFLKNNHYFMSEHVSRSEMIDANVECTKQILSQLQRKTIAASSFLLQEGGMSLSGIFDRLSSKLSTDDDWRFMETAREAISGDMEAEASDDIEETNSLLQLTELTARKKSRDAKQQTQKGDLVAACATQAEFAGVIENLVR